MHSIATGWLWAIFFTLVFCVLVIDLIMLGRRKAHPVTLREAFSWTLVWICCAFLFNLVLWISLKQTQGPVIAAQKSLEFFTGYLIEETLSFDNMFVIVMIFNFFAVPPEYQRRVLLYGVLGAMVMRFIMIFAGVFVINQFHWVLYLFGIFLIYSGIKMFFLSEKEKDLAQNNLLIWLRNHLRLTKQFHKERFFVRQQAKWYATPLFMVLIFVEMSDLIFALDSIPAIFSVTRDPFIIFTSNIFAVLGLRSIYFMLASLARTFSLLKYGIALVLIVIGGKILLEYWVAIPILLTLSSVVTILLMSILLSWLKQK